MPRKPVVFTAWNGPLRGWFLFFFVVQLGYPLPFGTNPASRWAMMTALSEEGTVRIDSYYGATIDWARTPDGHYYSNKAPGPALVGWPVFALADAWITHGIADRADRDQARLRDSGWPLRVLSFLFQILPYFFLTLLLARWAERQGAPPPVLAALVLALLFGNTACVFLNTYFGHAMTAVAALALYYGLLTRRVWLQGFAFGFAVLCEYSSALFLLPLLPIWIGDFVRSHQRVRWIAEWVGGGLLPGVAWVAYHTYCFGNPLHIANRYQNPLFVELATDRWNIAGLFFLPRAEALGGLLVGSSRGILWTQPWVLVLLALVLFWPAARRWVFHPARFRALGFPIGCFLLLLAMNSAFGAWHAGGSPGPRYLSAGLALLAAGLGSWLVPVGTAWRKTFLALVGVSIVLQLVCMSVYLGGYPEPGVPLWRFYWTELHGPRWGTPASRLGLGLPVVGFLFYRTWSAVFPPNQRKLKTNFAAASPH